VFSAYGAGKDPVIDAGGSLSGWNIPERWTEVQKEIWHFKTDRFPGRLWLSGREYGASGNDGGRGAITPTWRYRWWGNADGLINVRSDRNPALAFTDVEVAAEGRCAMVISNKAWLTFHGLQFRRGEICIDVEHGDHLLFDSCKVLGGTAKYGLWLRENSNDGIIRDCEFDREDTVEHSFEFTGEAGNANGQDNIALQWANRWDIYGNRIIGPGHDAISMSGEVIQGISRSSRWNRIHDNEIRMTGDYGRFTSTNSRDSVGLCSDNEIFRNVVIGTTVQSQILGKDNFLHDNVFIRCRKVPFDNLDYRSCAVDLSDYLSTGAEHVRVWNNTFVDCDAHAISISAGTRRASIRGNLIVNTGRLTGSGGHDFLDHVGIVIWPGATGDTIVGNVIWCEGKNPIVYQQPGWDANVKQSVDWLNARDGDHGNVIQGNIGIDPRLGADFRPAKGFLISNVGAMVDDKMIAKTVSR
jgi:hypothetical protein